MNRKQVSRALVVAVIALVLVGTIPATVAAQSNSQTGGTVVVEEDETVDELEAFGGTVVVEGTVTGDVNAVAGEVRINGDVGGNVEAAAGSVTIAGTVDGDVEAATGSFTLTEDGTVGGDVAVGAGSAVIDGTIEGSAEIGAETITLGDDAAIAGDLRYGGSLEGNTDAVAGEIEQDSSIGVDLTPTIQPIASWLFSAYVLVLNLVFGAALLALFPRFSDRVAGRVARTPVRSGLVGLGVLIGIPILLIALAITVVGIPFSFVGAFGFALMVWIGIIYGRYAVAAWLLSVVGVGNRWLALVVGLVGGAALAQLPYVGSLLNLLIFLLGLGALTYGLYSHRKTARDEPRSEVGSDGPTTD
ncbi:polymer-forming cytoskeletal protein [Natronorubrum thiooxidans]|uniref:Polymer-forming protein n=1 Tax=Natronorubrum thiooxidans TaxID=308853 RepID=A0A1N7EY01_9EURY|nr:polymer-forming cytoskeletal protein [Natronorubrum thiooxidans]SIR92988.1 Polymer-forming protein [Natronorubrum thiooxidans]